VADLLRRRNKMSEHSENSATNGNTVGNPPRKMRVLLETYGWPMDEYDFEIG